MKELEASASELNDLEPSDIDLDEVKGGMFVPARFPVRSSPKPEAAFPHNVDPVLSITRVDPT